MSSYDKRLFKGRNFIEDSELIKPSNLDDLDRDCFLFQDSNYKPEYLEMPIKIEGDLRQKSTKREQEIKHQSGNQSSQQLENNDIFYETTQKNFSAELYKDHLKDDYEELLNPHSRIDLIDSLLLQNLDAYSHMPNQINQFYMMEPCDVKQEEGLHSYQLPPSSENSQISILQQKRTAVLSLINTFRSFGQAINIAMNYHKLTKKDSLNKAHNNVFNVLSKESRKLQAQLDTQYARFSAMIDTEGKNTPQDKQKQKGLSIFGMSKELANTSVGHESIYIKTEEQTPQKKIK